MNWRLPFSPREDMARTAPYLSIAPISLMWPNLPAPMPDNPSSWAEDLGLEDLVHAFVDDRRYTAFVRQGLTSLVSDPDIIAHRQAVLADFDRNPALIQATFDLLPSLANLRQGSAQLGRYQRSLLLETSDRLAELDLYIEVVHTLYEALQPADLRSKALITLRDCLRALITDKHFETLRQQLPELRKPLENIASLTIGINLDARLRPISAVLLAINDRALGERASLLARLTGLGTNSDEETGIAPLHRFPVDSELRQFDPLFQDVDRALTQVAQPVARALNRYVRVSSSWLAHLEFELAFFAFATALMRTLRDRGAAVCIPEIAPAEMRALRCEALVNLHLAIRSETPPVPNDVHLAEDERIAILTGPNSGGKTTFVQAVGLAQVLFQAGLFIPAASARLSPVESIQTHFPALETHQEGRLAQEAARLRDMFNRITPKSLVLMNETFSSTASGEAVYLAQDVLCALRAIGARTFYATHLVELADYIDDIHAAVEGDSRVVSLVAGIQIDQEGRAVPTYRVSPGRPLGRSYAQEIARKHGISLGQILAARSKADRSPV